MEVADIPEAVAEAAAPAVKEGPLPFNYVANQDEGDGESLQRELDVAGLLASDGVR